MKKMGLIIASLFLLSSFQVVLFAATVTGGGLALEFTDNGLIEGVQGDGRDFPASAVPGGIFVRDVTGADSAASYLFEEGFETTPFTWFLPSQNGEIDFSLETDDVFEGQNSLLCQVNHDAVGMTFAMAISRVIAVTPGLKFRLQGEYKALRGYLSLEMKWQKKVYEPGTGSMVNGLGVFYTDSEGTIEADNYQLVAPFAKQASEWKPAGGEFIIPPGKEFVRIVLSVRLDPDYDYEGFMVDAIRLFTTPAQVESVTGETTGTANGLDFHGVTDHLDISASWTGREDSIDVTGTVRSFDQQSRCFDLFLSLPVDAVGWSWDASPGSQSMIEAGRMYSNTVSADVQAFLPVSLYPYNGIRDMESGLAAATPLYPVRASLIRYNAERKSLDVVFHLAVAPDSGHSDAGFSARFFLYRPQDGFRGIIQNYDDMYSENDSWFDSPFDASSFRSFDVGFFTGQEGAEQCAADDASDTLSVQYTVADLTVPRICHGTETPPTLAEVMDIITERSQSSDPQVSYYYSIIPEQLMLGTNGDPILKHISEESWTGGWVEAVFKIDASPEGITDGMHKYTADWILRPAFENTGDPDPSWEVAPSTLDAVQSDNFLASASVDSSPAHIQRTQHDLTYCMRTYTPALPASAAMYDYLKWLRTWLDDNTEPPYRGIQINWKGLGIMNSVLPIVDICAGEVNDAIVNGHYTLTSDSWQNFNPEILLYKRVMAGHKLRGMAFAGTGITENDVIETLDTALLYGMGAGFKDETHFVAPFTHALADELCRNHNALAADLTTAGWEPMTMAVTDHSDIRLERYGTPEDEQFYIVAHNYGEEPVDTVIHLASELNLNIIPKVIERCSGNSVTLQGGCDAWEIPIEALPPRRSLMFEVTPEKHGTGVQLRMPTHDYYAGDTCSLSVDLYNDTCETMEQYQLFVFLEIDGTYWFAPSWVYFEEGVDSYIVDIQPGVAEMEIIEPFEWPEDAGEYIGALFWAAITTPDATEIVGDVDSWSFSWH